VPEQGKKNDDRNRNSEQPQQRASAETHDPPPLKELQQRAGQKLVPGQHDREAEKSQSPPIDRRPLKTGARDRAPYSMK
jgi:hypothetical protein